MAIGYSQYPAAYDSYTYRKDVTDSVNAVDVNELQDALKTAQTTLGINPQGSKSTVTERLNTSLDSAGNITTSLTAATYFTIDSSGISTSPYLKLGGGYDKRLTWNNTSSRFELNSNTYISGDLTTIGVFAVTGVTNLTSDLNINSNKFQVTASSGNTLIAGTLGVTGIITGPTSSNTINGLIINSGALSGITTLSTSSDLTIGGFLGFGVVTPSYVIDIQKASSDIMVKSTLSNAATSIQAINNLDQSLFFYMCGSTVGGTNCGRSRANLARLVSTSTNALLIENIGNYPIGFGVNGSEIFTIASTGISTGFPSFFGDHINVQTTDGGPYTAAFAINFGNNFNSDQTAWINKYGYVGSNSHYRSLNIGDGKGNAIVSIDASTQAVTTTGAINAGNASLSAIKWKVIAGNLDGSGAATVAHGGGLTIVGITIQAKRGGAYWDAPSGYGASGADVYTAPYNDTNVYISGGSSYYMQPYRIIVFYQ